MNNKNWQMLVEDAKKDISKKYRKLTPSEYVEQLMSDYNAMLEKVGKKAASNFLKANLNSLAFKSYSLKDQQNILDNLGSQALTPEDTEIIDQQLEQYHMKTNFKKDALDKFKNRKLGVNLKANGYTLNAIFLLAHGLNTVLLDGIPLWDEEHKKMVKFAGFDKKDSKFIKNNNIDLNLNADDMPDYKTYPEIDKINLKYYDLVRKDHTDYKATDTFFRKETSDTMTIQDFIDNIYNLPINQEAIKRAILGHPLTDRAMENKIARLKAKGIDIDQNDPYANKELITKLKTKELDRNVEKYMDDSEALEDMYTSPELIEKLNEVKENHIDLITRTFIKKKQDGFTNEDLSFILKEWEKYLSWKDRYQPYFNEVKKKLEAQNKEHKLAELEDMKKTWFRSNLNDKELFKEIRKWYQGDSLTTNESINEARGHSIQPQRVSDPRKVTEIMARIGIPPKFHQIYILEPGIKDKETGKVIRPDRRFVIAGFEDLEKISAFVDYKEAENNIKSYLQQEDGDNETLMRMMNSYNQLKNEAPSAKTIVVYTKECNEQGVPTGRQYKMNLDTIYQLINLPENAEREFDTNDNELLKTYDTIDPHRSKNPGSFIHETLPPEMLEYLINMAKERYVDEVPRGFSIPHGLTGKTYEKYWGTRALLNTLRLSNYPAFRENGYKAQKKDGQIYYIGIAGDEKDSKMNRFPPKSITRMV